MSKGKSRNILKLLHDQPNLNLYNNAHFFIILLKHFKFRSLWPIPFTASQFHRTISSLIVHFSSFLPAYTPTPSLVIFHFPSAAHVPPNHSGTFESSLSQVLLPVFEVLWYSSLCPSAITRLF